MTSKSPTPKPPLKANKRGTARLHAVQALYQIELVNTPLNEVLATFNAFLFGKEIEGIEFLPADSLYFKNIVEGVVREQARLDPAINEILDNTWPLKRIDSMMRSILRAGAYEVFARADVPSKVILNEYVDIADSFLDSEGKGMVNAVLDEISKRVRGES